MDGRPQAVEELAHLRDRQAHGGKHVQGQPIPDIADLRLDVGPDPLNSGPQVREERLDRVDTRTEWREDVVPNPGPDLADLRLNVGPDLRDGRPEVGEPLSEFTEPITDPRHNRRDRRVICDAESSGDGFPCGPDDVLDLIPDPAEDAFDAFPCARPVAGEYPDNEVDDTLRDGQEILKRGLQELEDRLRLLPNADEELPERIHDRADPLHGLIECVLNPRPCVVDALTEPVDVVVRPHHGRRQGRQRSNDQANRVRGHRRVHQPLRSRPRLRSSLHGPLTEADREHRDLPRGQCAHQDVNLLWILPQEPCQPVQRRNQGGLDDGGDGIERHTQGLDREGENRPARVVDRLPRFEQ